MGGVFGFSNGMTALAGVPSFYRQQAAALCCRNEGDTIELLLVTGRGNRHWGIPKGCIEPGERSFETAEREAFEEAGIRGRCNSSPIGSFRYFKSRGFLPYEVQVHLLRVEALTEEYPEHGQRTHDWVPFHRAHAFIARKGLARLVACLGKEVDRHLEFGRLSLSHS